MARGKGRKITYEDLERRQREAKSIGFDSIFKREVPVFTPKDGDAQVRILRPEDSDHPFGGKDIFVHYGVGPDEGQYLCIDPSKNPDSPYKRCPICEAAADAARDGDQDTAKELRAGVRVAVWVLDRDSDKEEPMLYSMPRKVERNVIDLMKNKRLKTAVPICDWDEGYDIFFSRVGTGINTDYSGYQRDADPTPVCDDQKAQDEIQDYIEDNPIAEFLNFYEPKYLQRLLEGTIAEDDEGAADDRSGARDRGRSRGGRDQADTGARRASRRGDTDEAASDRTGRRRGADDADESTEADETDRGSRRSSRAEEPEGRSRRGRDRDAAPEEDETGEGEAEADANADRGQRRRSRSVEEPAEERTSSRGGREERTSRRGGREERKSTREERSGGRGGRGKPAGRRGRR